MMISLTNEAIIILVSLLVFAKTLRFTFVLDDKAMYDLNKKCKEDLYIFSILRKGQRNKLWHWFRAFRHAFYGAGGLTNTYWIDHLITIFLHTVICLQVYWFFGSSPLSLMTALLYCVNPINIQTSVWMNGRRYAMSIILAFTALLIFPPAYLLAPFFQINTIFAPLLMGWVALPLIGLFMALTLGYSSATTVKGFLSRRLPAIPNCELRVIKPRKAIIFIKSMGFYLYNSLLPVRKYFYYSYMQNFGLSKKGNEDGYKIDVYFWSSYVTVCGIISVLYYCFTHHIHTPLVYGLFFWVLFSAQWCNVFSVVQMFADRYMSFSSAFLMYAVSYCFLLLGVFYGFVAFLVLFLLYLTALYETMRLYEKPSNFYDYHLFYSPENIEARVYKASGLIRQSRFVEAFPVVSRGLAYNPDDFKINILVANCLLYIKPSDCEKFIVKAEGNVQLGIEDHCHAVVKDLRDKIAMPVSPAS